MRIGVLAVIGVVACASHAPRTVAIASLDVTPASPAVRATLLGDCRIAGTGERPRDDGQPPVPFEVFDSNDASEALFVIAFPERARAVWSNFPARADDGRTRARVAIGGQSHVRYTGFTNLYGRTFTATRRMDSDAGHLWARAGSPIEMMSASANGEIFARVTTSFISPKTIVVRGNCADIAYAPDLVSRPPRDSASSMSRTRVVRLYRAPGDGTPMTTITTMSHLAFDVLERREDRVRISAEDAHIGIDAWMNADEITDIGDRGFGPVPLAQTHTPSVVGSPMRVLRDTPLFAGAPLAPVAGAFVEKDAIVISYEAHSMNINGRVVVTFSFVDGFIVSPMNMDLGIALDALTPA